MNTVYCPKILAHRGLSHLAPENTIVAFEKAVQHGIEWLEFDVMLTKDHKAVIFHDSTLNRTTNGKGLVADKTLHQLQQLDAGSWFNKAYKGELIPSLEQVLALMKQHNLKAVVEIKAAEGQARATVENTIKTIEECWSNGFGNLIFSSFSLASLITIRKLLPHQKIGFGLNSWRKESMEICQALDCYSIHVNHRIITKNRIHILKKMHCHILAFTVNNPKRAHLLKNMGVDGFFSDHPEGLLKPVTKKFFYIKQEHRKS